MAGAVEKIALDVFGEVARNKGYTILEIGTGNDHAHMLVEVSDKQELPAMIRTLKAVSAKKILEATPHLRVGNGGHFGARRYGYKEVLSADVEYIRDYIRRYAQKS